MKVIKFTLKSNFAFFKNKEHLSNNHSYVTIPKTYVIGALGGIIGLSGFHKYSNNYKRINSLIIKIENEINKIDLIFLEEKLNLSIDSEILSLIKNKDKLMNDLISKNETINYIGTNKSINKIINSIKEKEEQINILSNSKIDKNIIDISILKNNIVKNLEILDSSKKELLILEDNLKLLKEEISLLSIDYKVLFENKISVITKKEINIVETTFNDSTMLGISNKIGSASQQVEHILTDVEYDVYYELKNNELDNKIENYLLNDKRIYDFYLGKNQFVADISNVEVLELEQLKENEFNDKLKVISCCDNNLIDETNLNIKINMPLESSKNGIYSKYKLLTIFENNINRYDNNLYKLTNNNLLYFI